MDTEPYGGKLETEEVAKQLTDSYLARSAAGFDSLSKKRVLAPEVATSVQYATVLFEKKNNYTRPVPVVPLICVFYMPVSLCENSFRLKLLRFLMKLCGFKFGEIKER